MDPLSAYLSTTKYDNAKKEKISNDSEEVDLDKLSYDQIHEYNLVTDEA